MNDLDILVVSLERTPERKASFKRFNGDILSNMHWEFFTATDGLKTISLPSEVYSPDRFDYSKGSIGAALSWVRLCEECISRNRNILGLEDDIVLHKEFEKHIQHVVSLLPNDFDITLVSYNFDSVLEFQIVPCDHLVGRFVNTELTDGRLVEFQHSLIHPTIVNLKHAFGTSGVLLSPRGAKKLLEICLPLDNREIAINGLKPPFYSYSIDGQFNDAYTKLNAFAVVPPIGVVANLKETSLTRND